MDVEIKEADGRQEKYDEIGATGTGPGKNCYQRGRSGRFAQERLLKGKRQKWGQVRGFPGKATDTIT